MSKPMRPNCQNTISKSSSECCSKWFCKAAASNLHIVIALFEQDICGPCVVPSVCRKFLLLKIELLHVKQSFEPSKIHSTGEVLADLLNKTDLTASKPDLLSC